MLAGKRLLCLDHGSRRLRVWRIVNHGSFTYEDHWSTGQLISAVLLRDLRVLVFKQNISGGRRLQEIYNELPSCPVPARCIDLSMSLSLSRFSEESSRFRRTTCCCGRCSISRRKMLLWAGFAGMRSASTAAYRTKLLLTARLARRSP